MALVDGPQDEAGQEKMAGRRAGIGFNLPSGGEP